MKTRLHCRTVLLTGVLILTVSTPVWTQVAATPADATTAAVSIAQPEFVSPEDAAKALADAVRSSDAQAIAALMGPDSEDWLFTGDNVSDRAEWTRFLEAWDKQHAVLKDDNVHAQLVVGDDDWPFPAPIVKSGERWGFNGEAGREEVIKRRVGRNELNTIQTLLAVVDAQHEYATTDANGNGFIDYAGRFISTPGTKDGLYWAVDPGEEPSPLGLLVGAAARKGYDLGIATDEPQPYHGYLYHLLTEQGADAPGGAYNYLVNDRLVGGFAVVASPARYGISGIMTLMVNHLGQVYQKDLGEDSAAISAAMHSFNPDASWSTAE